MIIKYIALSANMKKKAVHKDLRGLPQLAFAHQSLNNADTPLQATLIVVIAGCVEGIIKKERMWAL